MVAKLADLLAMTDSEFEEWLKTGRKEEEERFRKNLFTVGRTTVMSLEEMKQRLLAHRFTVSSAPIFMTETELRRLRGEKRG